MQGDGRVISIKGQRWHDPCPWQLICTVEWALYFEAVGVVILVQNGFWDSFIKALTNHILQIIVPSIEKCFTFPEPRFLLVAFNVACCSRQSRVHYLCNLYSKRIVMRRVRRVGGGAAWMVRGGLGGWIWGGSIGFRTSGAGHSGRKELSSGRRRHFHGHFHFHQLPVQSRELLLSGVGHVGRQWAAVGKRLVVKVATEHQQQSP